MKFYNKLREHFNNISAGGFWIRKKYSGRSQIIFGIAFGIIAVPIILINGLKFQPVSNASAFGSISHFCIGDHNQRCAYN